MTGPFWFFELAAFLHSLLHLSGLHIFLMAYLYEYPYSLERTIELELGGIVVCKLVGDAEISGVDGSSVDLPPRGFSWISLWKHMTGRAYAPKCSFYGCYARSAVGGHVWVKYQRRSHQFIVPICSYHNYCQFSEEWHDIKKGVLALRIASHPDTD